MANTYVTLNVHVVFHTKSNTPMRREDLSRVHDYIGGIIKRLNASVIAIGGVENHVHILSSLPKTMALSDYVRTIKAESSRWIKGLDTCYRFFAWQEGYGAFLSPLRGYVVWVGALMQGFRYAPPPA